MPRGYSQACIQVTDRSDTQGTIATISCGSAHAAAITHKGHLLTWGSNSQGQCGVDPAQTPEQLDTGGASTRSNTSSRRVVRPARVHATRMGHVL
jgi:alpha-tubulin suppressor-like RCC1 family protein